MNENRRQAYRPWGSIQVPTREQRPIHDVVFERSSNTSTDRVASHRRTTRQASPRHPVCPLSAPRRSAGQSPLRRAAQPQVQARQAPAHCSSSLEASRTSTAGANSSRSPARQQQDAGRLVPHLLRGLCRSPRESQAHAARIGRLPVVAPRTAHCCIALAGHKSVHLGAGPPSGPRSRSTRRSSSRHQGVRGAC
jgi:hypothetical protein